MGKVNPSLWATNRLDLARSAGSSCSRAESFKFIQWIRTHPRWLSGILLRLSGKRAVQAGSKSITFNYWLSLWWYLSGFPNSKTRRWLFERLKNRMETTNLRNSERPSSGAQLMDVMDFLSMGSSLWNVQKNSVTTIAPETGIMVPDEARPQCLDLTKFKLICASIRGLWIGPWDKFCEIVRPSRCHFWWCASYFAKMSLILNFTHVVAS